MQRLPQNESARLDVLERYDILDTPRESDFDDIVAIAAGLSETPIAYVSFIDTDRLWFKSVLGFEATEVPRSQTYCQYVVAGQQKLVIEDTLSDDVITPLVSQDGPPMIGMPGQERQIRFYLGIPLRGSEEHVLGTLCVLDYAPRHLPDATIDLLEKLATQVTRQLELRRSNAALHEEGETFSRLFDTAPVPLILAYDGLIVRANGMFAALLNGVDPASLRDRPVADFLPERDADERESFLVHCGTSIPVLIESNVLYRRNQRYDLIGVVDIRDRIEKERVLQEQRMQAENANRIKDSFLSLVSHDLKSPLSGILTVLDLLTSAGDRISEEYKERAMRDMRTSAALLVEMINQLLNIHRLQTGTIEVYRSRVLVAEIAERIVVSLNKQIEDKDLTIDIDVPDGHTIDADPGLFREALFNLVSNAIKFSPEGGRVSIRAADDRVIVEDDGAGVPEEDVPDLFRHEVKTSRPGTHEEPGTGLGLPLTMDIMRAHDGTVLLDRSADPRTRFVLDFSVASPVNAPVTTRR